MNREIKFRAWNKKLKTFAPDNCGIQIQGDNAHVSFDFFDGNFDTTVWYLDDVELMQFTGLKDKNGVEIYEGDIIHAFGAPLEVKWIVDGWFADCELTEVCEAGQEWDGNCEVMGNIHENPELINP